MAPFRTLGLTIAQQRGGLLCWVPVFLAIGIGGYFSMPIEPSVTVYGSLILTLLLLVVFLRFTYENWRPILSALVLVGFGAGLGGIRAHQVGEPVLSFRYYGPIQGRIVRIDRSGSDAVRLTLDRVVLKRMDPARTPTRVRVSLHGQQGFVEPEPGLVVILTAHLSPPSGPVEPGGYDFQRKAWFDGLGAVGYTRTPVLAWSPAVTGSLALQIYTLRMQISNWVQTSLPGDAGAFAAAVTTGDRSALPREAMEDLRASNLAHLLAISGLHMGLLTGFIFALVRLVLVTVPIMALTAPIKKIAACVALVSGAIYLALSGGNVATERAFIMVAVMFVAVLLDRRAVTLRAVAVAATIVLLLRPEVLPEPGFQMSFAATTALVAVFGVLRRWPGMGLPRWLRPVAAVAISSAVAGLATAPIAAAHFNRIADYGLLANLLSVPLMGMVVMPGAVLTACLAPFGLGWIGLAIMRPAIEWILGVAHWVAGLEGSITHVVAPPAMTLPLIAIGALGAVLWRGTVVVRLICLAPAVVGFALWSTAERPALLISDTGGLVGILTTEGRALNKERGDGFSAGSWLENDGDAGLQADAFLRSGFEGTKGNLRFDVGGQRFVHLSGRKARERLPDACVSGAVVILTVKLEPNDYPCDLFDPARLRQTGAVAVIADDAGPLIVTARDRSGQRLWNSHAARKRFENKTWYETWFPEVQ